MDEIKVEVKDMYEAIDNYMEWFKSYDFYISESLPKEALKSIYLKDNDRYVVFRTDITREIMEQKLKDFMEEQRLAFLEGKGLIDF